jgi:hypothetical protein
VLPVTCCQSRVASHVLPVICCLSSVASQVLPVMCCQSRVVSHVLPVTCCQSHVAVTCCQSTCCQSFCVSFPWQILYLLPIQGLPAIVLLLFWWCQGPVWSQEKDEDQDARTALNARSHDQVEQFQTNRDQERDFKVKDKMQVKHGQGKSLWSGREQKKMQTNRKWNVVAWSRPRFRNSNRSQEYARSINCQSSQIEVKVKSLNRQVVIEAMIEI